MRRSAKLPLGVGETLICEGNRLLFGAALGALALLPSPYSINSPEQVGKLYSKCLGDGFYALQRQVSLASFDLPDVRPMHSAHLSQLLLRPFAFLS